MNSEEARAAEDEKWKELSRFDKPFRQQIRQFGQEMASLQNPGVYSLLKLRERHETRLNGTPILTSVHRVAVVVSLLRDRPPDLRRWTVS